MADIAFGGIELFTSITFPALFHSIVLVWFAFGGIELIISNRPCVCFNSVTLVDFAYGGIEPSTITSASISKNVKYL